jgi:hypothetical protein
LVPVLHNRIITDSKQTNPVWQVNVYRQYQVQVMKGVIMKTNGRAIVLFVFAAVLVVVQLWGTEAQSRSSFFTGRGCATCHSAPVAATCNGCHYHGSSSLRGTTAKTIYAPGESVTVTVSGGSQSGWIRAALYDQNNNRIAVSSGNASGMGSSTTYPATLSAPAPATPGTYTWKAAWYGNSQNTGSAHGEVTVNTNSFTVAAPLDTTPPVIGTFSLPATATGLTVPVTAFTATDNVAVTGYTINTSAVSPAAGAVGWTATPPANVTAPGAGSTTFHAWAKDAAGNVSLSKSAVVTVTVDTTKPTLVISALENGAYTNLATHNLSGNASDAGGLQSVTVNDQAVAVNPDGSFSFALSFVPGGNTVTVTATDNAGNQQAETRTIIYDPTAPILTVSAPADNSSSAQAFISLIGTVNETSTVTVTDNGGNTQNAALTDNGFSATVFLTPGVNTILIDAVDLAGNTTNAKRTIIFDSTKLTLAVTYPDQDITTSQNNITIQGAIADALSAVTITISVDGQTYTPQVIANSFSQLITFSVAKTYAIMVTATDEAANQTTVQRNIIYEKTAGGDINSDGNVDIADALLALRISVGLIPMEDKYMAGGDVAPYIGGQSQSDGKIDVADALIILRKCVGLIP